MTITFSQLFAPNQVNHAANETLYTVPSTPTTSLLRNCRIRFANTSAAACTIEGWAVQSGGSASDSNSFLPLTSLAAYNYLDIDVPVMSAGGFIQAKAGTATSITATCLDGFIQS